MLGAARRETSRPPSTPCFRSLMAVTVHFHAFYTDATGKKTEIPGSPYPTEATADTAISSYETAHPGTGGYYTEERRFDQLVAPTPTPTPQPPPPTAAFLVATLAAAATVNQPVAFQATLRNSTASPVP